MRRGFTLIEMMVSISILSIMMIFLYKSYAQINLSNRFYDKELKEFKKFDTIKKVFYLDFSLAKKIKIINQDKYEDVVFLETNHSIHDKISPYIAYILKEKNLYRLESFKPFSGYPLSSDDEFVVDKFENVKVFRVYISKENKSLYLLNVIFKDKKEILLKIKALNI